MVQPDDTLGIRAALLGVGLIVGVIGMTTNTDWLIYAAIGVIAIGGILAILRRIKRE